MGFDGGRRVHDAPGIVSEPDRQYAVVGPLLDGLAVDAEQLGYGAGCQCSVNHAALSGGVQPAS